LIKPIIDTHIHLDLYKKEERNEILQSMKQYKIDGLISVSQHFYSAQKNLDFSDKYDRIFPAFGFHPEQPLPNEEELDKLIQFIQEQHTKMIAVGEVGLPYYSRKKDKSIKLEEYIELLERFIILAKQLEKPIILHAVYEDAPIVCSLLEKYSIEKAHFHWFKGDTKTMERMIDSGYFVSVTPDVLYKSEIQRLVVEYPLSQLMVETDGPWPFEDVFKDQVTHPKMIHESINAIANIKYMDKNTVYEKVYRNTMEFYGLGTGE